MKKLYSNTRQYLAGLIVVLFGCAIGLMIGWSSPAILLLTSDHSPLKTGKISTEEASWVASFSLIGSLVAYPLIAFLASKYGRKVPMIILSMPAVLSWVFILITTNVYYVYAARFFAGLSRSGLFTLCQLYVVEVTIDSLRGPLGTGISVGVDFGTFLAFALGSYFNYIVTPSLAIALTILFAILLCFVPETPPFLLKSNRILAAKKSIRFYHNIKGTTDNGYEFVNNKIEKLKHQINHDNEPSVNGRRLKWTDFTVNPGRKAMTIGIVLSIVNDFSGATALITFAATIFKASGSILSSNDSALIVAGIQFIGTSTLPFLVERIGRKALYVISTSGTAFGYTTLATYLLLKSLQYDVSAFDWMSVVCLPLVTFCQTIGLSTLLHAYTTELLPENIREFGICFCHIVQIISSFIVHKFILYMMEALGVHGVLYFFAGVCIPTMLFIIFYAPETKGQSYDQIMKSLQ